MKSILQFVLLVVAIGSGFNADSSPHDGPLETISERLSNQSDEQIRDMMMDGGWIVIQHRFDGSVNFFRSYNEYRNGFGNLDGEFWLGLEVIHALTSSKHYELVIQMEDFDGATKYARYGKFALGGADEFYYTKNLEPFSGTAGNSFLPHTGTTFQTYDREYGSDCPRRVQGGWWYNDNYDECGFCNLNGPYGNIAGARSMFWFSFHHSFQGLKSSKMMIRAV